jgi:hypothetical protein
MPKVLKPSSLSKVFFVTSIAQSTNTGPKSSGVTARTPSPASALSDGKVIVSEAVYGGDGAHDETEKNIKAVVSEVEPSRGSDEYSKTERSQGDGQ